MSPHEVIKKFMYSLDTHPFKLSSPTFSGSPTDDEIRQAWYNRFNEEKDEIKLNMLNKAITDSSHYTSINDVINKFVSDCQQCITADPTNGWNTFLKEKCGIVLENDDTGSIIGSDANIVKENETIGSGIERTKYSIVPEYGNYYEAVTPSSKQEITTGTGGWIVKGTNNGDTIISLGEDYIITGSGNNNIEIKGVTAILDLAKGNNTISIDNNTKSVILFNYNSATSTITGNTSIVKLEADNSKAGIFSNINSAIISSDSNIKLNGTDNYFNIDGVETYNGNQTIQINLDNARVLSNPSIVGGFILTDNNDLSSLKFVSTNEEAKRGQLVGHIASVYPKLMSFSFKGVVLNIQKRQLLKQNGSVQQILKEFETFDDVGTDTSNSFQNIDSNNNVFTDTDTGNEYERYIVASLYKWWVKESLTVNYLDFNYSFEDRDTTICTIDTYFNTIIGGSNGVLASVNNAYDITNGYTVALSLNINKDMYKNLTDFNDVNGGDERFYLDRTIVHEFNHAIMSSKINYFSILPKFLREGMAELTHGIDDKRLQDIIAHSQNSDLLKSSVDLNDNFTNGANPYAGGYMLLRYFAKQTALYDEQSETPIDPENPSTGEDPEDPGTGTDTGETPSTGEDPEDPGTGIGTGTGETPTDPENPSTGEDPGTGTGETPTDPETPSTGDNSETVIIAVSFI